MFELKTTLEPLQNVVGPFGIIVGVAGLGFTIVVTGADVAVLQAFVTETVNVPAEFTTIPELFDPLLQVLPVVALEDSTME